MSGTSLDGIDLAEILLKHNSEDANPEDSVNRNFARGWTFKILKAKTIPYSSFWKNKLRKAIHFSEEELERLDFKYTEKLSEEILRFIKQNNIQEIDAICSHGHTIVHKPEEGFTFQIGNLPRLAKLVSRKVVCDFRTQDVKMGGQGAPLVPIGDRLLFPEYDYCLNLGGFANVSSEVNNRRIAYDICPVNIVLNRYAEKLGSDFDESGNFAREGQIQSELLQKLNSLSFYQEKPPKSLGSEWVNEHIFPILETFDIPVKSILRTFTEHIAIQLSKQFRENCSVLITGGGVYNSFLIERLKHISKIEIIIPPAEIIEFKEALIFGLLGVLKIRGEINCLSSVTGARSDHSSGEVYLP